MQIVNLFDGKEKVGSRRLYIHKEQLRINSCPVDCLIINEQYLNAIFDWVTIRGLKQFQLDLKYLPAILAAIKKEVEG